MDNENIKSFKVKRILNISLISLLVLFFLLLIFGFVRILPKDIEYTNITSNSFTVSWSTRFPTKGVVSVVDAKNRLPIAFTSLGKVLGFDTRDIRFSELRATQEASEKIWESNSQSVSLGDIVTEKVVDEKGSYYTHHIEVRGVNPESEYRVMVGDGLFFVNSSLFKDEPTIKTLEVADGIDTPIPTYGLIKNANGEDLPIGDLLPVNDGVVYFNYFEELSGERSNTYSSSLNEEGAWYMDISTAVDSDGELFFKKYSQTVSNIYGELYIDLGPLGKWKKRINMNEASPAETIVINIPGYVENPDDPSMLIKVDGSNAIEEEVVKGVSAQQDGCTWIDYCTYGRFDKEQNKWVNCSGVDSTLEARKCGEQKDAHEAAQELGTNKGTCPAQSGSLPIGTYTMYGSTCMRCEWQNSTTKNYGVWRGQPESSGCIQGGGPGEEETVDDCTNASVGAKCTIGGKEGTCQNPYPGSTFRVCIPSKQTGDGVKDYIIVTDKDIKCEDTDGCICLYGYENSKAEEEKHINNGETCFKSASSNPPEEDPLEPKILEPKNTGKQECWENFFGFFYKMGTDGKKYICIEGKWLETGDTYSCYESECDLFSKCYFEESNKIYECGIFGFREVDKEGTNIKVALNIATLSAASGTCKEQYCLCTSGDMKNKIVSKGEVCPEVSSSSCSSSKKDKICNTKGYTCQPSGRGVTYICSPSSEGPSSSIKGLSSSVLGQESTDFILDSQTGMFTNLTEGVYTFSYNEETYVFSVSEEDLQKENGNIEVYVDTNKNGIYDGGEDKKVSELASRVSLVSLLKSYEYEISEGFNFVSFPFLIDSEDSRTAAGLLKNLNEVYNNAFYSISKYDGKWSVVGQNVEVYDNNDFQLIPGQGYIIKANTDITISIVGQPVKFDSDTDNAPITFYPGWNLIGVYGSNIQPYTAKSLIQSINKYEPVDFTADNVSKWESDMQRYEGLQLTNENGMELEYGFDFPINTLQSYFVRILEGKGNWQPDVR